MELKVKTLDGGDHMILIDEESTLAQFRLAIETKTGVVPTSQRLIFQGKVLTANERSLKDLGLANGHTLHMVERAPNQAFTGGASGGQPTTAENATNGSSADGNRTMRNRNVVVGTLPIQRLPSFTVHHTTELIQGVLNQIGGRIGRSGTITVEENVPQQDDLTVRLHLSGTRPTSVDSPARERLEHVTRQMRRLERMLAMIQHITMPTLELFLAIRRSDRDPGTMTDAEIGYPLFPDEEAAVEAAVPGILSNDRPAFAAESMGTTENRSAIEERRVSGGYDYTMRHGTVQDLCQYYREWTRLQRRQMEIMDLFDPILRAELVYNRNNSEGQVAGRLHHEVQAALHLSAHIAHALSDLNMHLCEPTPRRLYPQYSHFELDEPTEADITLTFSPSVRQRVSPGSRPQSQGSEAAAPPARGFFPTLDASRTATAAAMTPTPQFPTTPPGAGVRMRVPMMMPRMGPGPAGSIPFPMNMAGGTGTLGNQPPLLPANHPMAGFFGAGMRPQGNVRMQVGPNGQIRIEGMVPNMNMPPGGMGILPRPMFAAHQPPANSPPSTRSQAPNAAPQAAPQQQPAQAGNGLQNMFQNLIQAAVGNIFGAGGQQPNVGQTQPVPQPHQMNATTGNSMNANVGGTLMQGTFGPGGQITIVQQTGPIPRSPSAPNMAGQPNVQQQQQNMQQQAANAINAVTQAAAAAFGGGPVGGQPNQAAMNMGHQHPGMMPQQGHAGMGGRVFVGRNSIPWQQTGLHPANQHAAVFVGNRPPSELPLFTTDPFLPCPSRHFDMRDRLHHQHRQPNAGQQASQTQTGDATTATETSSPETAGGQPADALRAAAAGQIRVNRNGQAIFDTEAEFTAFLEHILRSVINNMSETDPNMLNDVERAADQPRRVYAFQPLPPSFPVITGTISMQAGPSPGSGEGDGQGQEAEATISFVTGEAVMTNSGDESDEQMDSADGDHGAGGGAAHEMAQMMAQVMRQLASGQNVPLREFIRSFNEEEVVLGRDRGITNMIMAALTDTMGLQDIMAVLHGDYSSLNRIQPQVRRFLCQNLLNDNSRPSPEDLHSATGRIAGSRADFLRLLSADGAHLTPMVPAESGSQQQRAIDLIETAINVEETAIERILRLVFGIDPTEEGQTIGNLLIETLSVFARRMVVLGDLAMGTGPGGYDVILRRYMEQQMPEANEMMGMLHTSLDRMRAMIESGGPLTVEDFRPLIAWAPDIPNDDDSTMPAAQSGPVENRPIEPIFGQPLSLAPSDSVASIMSSASSEMTLTADERGNLASASEADVTPREEAVPAGTAAGGADQAWKRVLPAEWVAVIEKDVERQNQTAGQPQAPFSDAYMMGMPAKRRRVVVPKNANADEVLRDTLRHSLVGAINATGNEAPGAAESSLTNLNVTPDLLDAFGAELDEGIRERLRTDPDYDPDKFPAIATCFKPESG